MKNQRQGGRTLLSSVIQNQAINSCSANLLSPLNSWSHITPFPFGEGLGGEAVGGEAVVGEAVFYSALSTCSLICSSSSFIFTTMFCISAWLLLEPVVLISRPISWAMKPSFLPLGVSSSSVSRKYFR